MNKKINKRFISTLAILLIGDYSTIFAGTIPKVYLNSNKLLIQQFPMIANDTTYVPLHTVENLGATIEWDDKTQTATIKYGINTIEQRIGSNTARVNSKIVDIPAPAIKKNGITYIPIKFVSQVLGAKLNFNKEENAIYIESEMPTGSQYSYDAFGRLLRKDNLPKNAIRFKEFTLGVPNGIYELPFAHQTGNWHRPPVEGRDYIYPIDMGNSSFSEYSTYKWYTQDNLERWVKLAEIYLDHMLNVDYRTIDYTWAQEMLEVHVQTDLAANYTKRRLNLLKEYVDYIKQNKIIIEGDYYVEPNTCHDSIDGITLRVWVKYKGNKDFKLYEDVWNNKGNTTYEGFSFVGLGTKKGGDDGSTLVVMGSNVGNPIK